jgi:hypothetical protein
MIRSSGWLGMKLMLPERHHHNGGNGIVSPI